MAKKILVIDDEEDLCWFVKLNLEEDKQYEVVVANSGSEGIEKAKKESPDLILLDILMPDMEGSEVAEKLASYYQTKNIPIIFLTAIVRKEEAERTIGGKHFIAKPVETKKLKASIEEVLSMQG
ncbi:MAG: response regulator [Candidatus Omnitrophica bacterium]|nr:response regulator [Candidatus Omnitrophota bacterium]MCF7894068.1 response regulator [Candidatus Omnitrophota bacterium]